MAGGRPSKYKPEYCAELIKHFESGLCYDAFAGVVSVCVDTLYQWEKDHAEFSEAKKVGRPKQLLALNKLILSGAMGQLKSVASRTSTTVEKTVGKVTTKTTTVKETFSQGFNAAAMIFTMKNCTGWKDQPDFSDEDEIDAMDFEEEEA